MAVCFRRKTIIIRPIKNIFKVQPYNKEHFKVVLKSVVYWPDDDRLTAETC